MKTNFWPRSNFPLQPRSKETSRVPSEARGSTKEHNWPKGKERGTLSREIVTDLLLLKKHTFLFRIKGTTGLPATPFSRIYSIIVFNNSSNLNNNAVHALKKYLILLSPIYYVI